MMKSRVNATLKTLEKPSALAYDAQYHDMTHTHHLCTFNGFSAANGPLRAQSGGTIGQLRRVRFF